MIGACKQLAEIRPAHMDEIAVIAGFEIDFTATRNAHVYEHVEAIWLSDGRYRAQFTVVEELSNISLCRQTQMPLIAAMQQAQFNFMGRGNSRQQKTLFVIQYNCFDHLIS